MNNTLITLVAILFIAHGLVHGALNLVPYQSNLPFWPSWWRPEPGHSWLLQGLGASDMTNRIVGGTIWLIAALGFVFAGLGLLGVPFLQSAWPALTVIAAVVSLLMFVLFWHPWLVVGAVLNFGALFAAIFARGPLSVS